jgi:acyl-coenzyme A thioesterase PaaI-like protein
VNDTMPRTRDDANHCFVCGPDNPLGLQLSFRVDGDTCRGRFVPGPHHGGFDGVTHGGIVFAVLDDAMANWFFLQGARGYTAKCDIRYRAPLPLGRPAAIECELLRRKGRLVQLGARALDEATGKVLAEAEASFMLDDAGALPAGAG